MDTLHLLTRSHLIAYRKYLGETYAKATAARMFSIARRILQEYVYQGALASNPAAGIKTFPLANETPYTTLSHDEAKALLKTVDMKTTKGKRDYAILSLLLRTGLRRSECSALNIGDLKPEQGHTIAVIQHGKGDKRGIVKVPVETPSRFVCKEGQSRNKQGEKTGPPSQEALAEQKEAAEICKSHQGKRPLRSSCYTGPSANHISLQTTHSGWLLVCQQPSVFSCYETGILGKWMSCMTAQAMVRQLVSVVNASI